MKRTVAGAAALLLAGAIAGPADAAGYRLRMDAAVRSFSFRTVVKDSIARADVVVRPDGSLWTPDGYAVDCGPGDPFCTYFRSGEDENAAPVVTSATLSLWDERLPGWRVRARGRFGFDARGPASWIGTDREGELIDAFAEWAGERGRLQAGRLRHATRFGWLGYDGGRIELRRGPTLRAEGWAGWGLAESSTLPATDPAHDPLGDFRPQRRQWVFGSTVAVEPGPAQLRGTWFRELDPRARNLVSERVALEASVDAPGGLRFAGAADRDLGAGRWGRAEASVGLRRTGLLRGARAEVRRYLPYFPLWTIWGVFSPAAYTSVSGRLEVAPLAGVRLWGAGERYTYEDTGAAAPLFATVDDGWRWSAGTAWSPGAGWDASAAVHTEKGPGAASRGYRAALRKRLTDAWRLRLDASQDRRPLEFRFADTTVRTVGFAVDALVGGQRVRADARWVEENLDRPDAAAFEESGWRLGLAATFETGSSPAVPPAVLRIPRAGGTP